MPPAETTPLPTPYDILPLPYFPSSPGIREWLVFLILCLILLLALRIRRGSSTSSQLHAPVEVARASLRQLAREAANSETPNQYKRILYEISLVLRRFIGVALGVPAAELTARELRDLEIGRASPETMRELIAMVITLDDFKYRPLDITREQVLSCLTSAQRTMERVQ